MQIKEKEWQFVEYVARRLIEKELSRPRKTQWPPVPTLLTCPAELLPAHLNGLGNRDHWTITEWQAYADFLRDSGQVLTDRLDKTSNQLQLAQHKLCRKPKGDNPESIRRKTDKTLLTGLYSPTHPSKQPKAPKPKRGRPAKDWSEVDHLIDVAVKIQSKQTHPISNKQALLLAAKHLQISKHGIKRLINPASIKRFSARYPKK